RASVLRFVRDFYPLLLMAFFYWEYSWLTHLGGGALHDPRVVGWDQSLFGFQPSQELHKMWPWQGLSEHLRAAYFFSYLVPVSALRLSRRVFWGLCAVVPALVLATVYGGFHYGVDSLAGFAVGVLAGVLGPRVHGFFAQRLPRSRHRPSVNWGAPLPKTGGRA